MRNHRSELRMHSKLTADLANGVNPIAQSPSEPSSSKRTVDDSSMFNDSSSRSGKRGRGA